MGPIAYIKSKVQAKAQSPPEKKRKVTRPRVFQWAYGDYTLHNSEIIFSAVTRISNALSTMPIQLYKGLAKVDNELNDLLRSSPNPNMTSCNFIKTMEAARCTSGNSYALKMLRPDMSIDRIDVLDSSRVTPIILQDTNELWYRLQTDNDGEIYVHNYYIIHLQFVSTNGFSGVNPVSVLFDTLNYSENIQKYSIEQLSKGINVAVVLEAPANLGEVQKKQMISDFTETYKETGGNILLLESGVTAKALNLSPVDTRLFEVEKITRSKVAMVYNIPTHLLGDYSESSYSSMEQEMLEFLSLTMLPIVTMYEQEFNRKLLTAKQRMEGYAFKLDMNALLRADALTKAETNYKAVRSGWKTPNEIRAEYGDAPLEYGDKALISRDLIPLEITTTKTEMLLGKGNATDENRK